MTSSAIPLSSFKDYIAPMTDWVQQNPRLASITAVAFAVLGITAVVGVTSLAASISIVIILGLAAALSFSAASFLTFQILGQTFFKSRNPLEEVQGSPPNIALSDVAGQKNYRTQVMNETLGHLKAGFYTSPDGTCHSLDLVRAARGSSLLLSARNVGQRPGNEQTRISVKDQDCLYAAAELHSKGLNPIVLDMASDGHFGGGYLSGAAAQEEDCCRRSGLCMACDTHHRLQNQNFYPLSRHSRSAGIYVPHVPIFRAGYEKGYQYLNCPFEVAFGVVAAIASPHLDHASGSPRLRDIESTVTREKIRTFFEMARQKGHQSVVFSAFGCGAFRNPPEHIAEITMDVITNEFAHCFKEIVIAVVDDHNAGHAHNPEGNFKPFARRALSIGGSVFNAKGQQVREIA